jgi:hypothetical protein
MGLAIFMKTAVFLTVLLHKLKIKPNLTKLFQIEHTEGYAGEL